MSDESSRVRLYRITAVCRCLAALAFLVTSFVLGSAHAPANYAFMGLAAAFLALGVLWLVKSTQVSGKDEA